MTKQRDRDEHRSDGPGLKVLSRDRWYGGGYCGICGDRGPSLIPQAVRYWDPDDGWRMGVLCQGCGEDAAARGPHPDDYAVATRALVADQQARIDVGVSLGDLDGTTDS